MLVMMGSELVKIDIPGVGQFPIIHQPNKARPTWAETSRRSDFDGGSDDDFSPTPPDGWGIVRRVDSG